MDSNSVATLVTACATAVYGIGTIFLVYQLWRDRVQRDRHFQTDSEAQKLNELRRAFYEACGYWLGLADRVAGSGNVDRAQAGREFEALVRLEWPELRINGHSLEANNLGFVIRANFQGIDEELGRVGVALGLVPSEYRQANAVGFRR